jgi:holo-[acyl-carrier protein] synthase
MNLIGHGIDLVDTARIAKMLDEHGERFLGRCFTAAEHEYCHENGRRRIERLAARFAAKEAVLKALGTGWRDGIAWTDIEVVREPSGRPGIRLHGRAARIAAELGIAGWHLSLTHTQSHAMASVIATA